MKVRDPLNDQVFSSARKNGFVLLTFLLGTFVFYFPVLKNGFVADDYASLYRITIEKKILYKEFLRPLIDISFYFNYLLSGLHPTGYYLFNFCIHALSAYMVFVVAKDFPLFVGNRQFFFAWMAGTIFLVYPFHNESIRLVIGQAVLYGHPFWVAGDSLQPDHAWFAGFFTFGFSLANGSVSLRIDHPAAFDHRAAATYKKY